MASNNGVMPPGIPGAPGAPGGFQPPIVGQKRFLMVCPKGHVDELAVPFGQMFPDPKTGRAVLVVGCRICTMLWFSQTFHVREMTPEEEKSWRETGKPPVFEAFTYAKVEPSRAG